MAPSIVRFSERNFKKFSDLASIQNPFMSDWELEFEAAAIIFNAVDALFSDLSFAKVAPNLPHDCTAAEKSLTGEPWLCT